MLAKVPSRPTGTGRRRAGSLTLELLFVFPILLALLLATVEFSLFAVARQQLSAASREGARVAALGGSQAEVEAAVQLFLGQGTLGQAETEVVLTDEDGNPILPGGAVAVWVKVPAGMVVPDLLAFIGFTIKDDWIVAHTVMRKE